LCWLQLLFLNFIQFCLSVAAQEASPSKWKSGALLKLSIKQLWGAAFLQMLALDEV
jgi:hypothetical protein